MTIDMNRRQFVAALAAMPFAARARARPRASQSSILAFDLFDRPGGRQGVPWPREDYPVPGISALPTPLQGAPQAVRRGGGDRRRGEPVVRRHTNRDFHFARRIRAFITPTRLSARQISSSHVASLPVEAALDVEPTRAPAFRASLRHRSTPMLFLRQADFVALRPGVSRPAPVAPRSSAACRRTAAGSDDLPPAGASSTAHASPGGLRFSPAAAEDS